MFDFSLPDSWLNDMLEDDAPYSGGGGIDPLETIDLSTGSDKEVIGFVRANYEQYKEKNLCPPANDDDPSFPPLDPWELDRLWFITSKKFGSDEKTCHGYWKEKDNEFTAIRGDHWQQPAQRRLVYIGFKRTLEFYMNDGAKTDWLMDEFAMIHQSDDGHFFLKEERSSLARYSKKTRMRTCAFRCIHRIVPGIWSTTTVSKVIMRTSRTETMPPWTATTRRAMALRRAICRHQRGSA